MKEEDLARKVVDKMHYNDPFSLWLDIVRVEDAPGRSVLQMKVRKEMLNGFSILHGGVTFSLADSALAFASNSHGIQSVSIETSISYLEPAREGDVLTATAEEQNRTHRTALYYISVVNQDGKKIALFKGTVYRTGKEWFPENT